MTQPAEHTPPPRMEIPNHTNYQPNEEILRLRRRTIELVRLGAATPETFQQTIMQLWQEGERRRQASIAEAEDHLRKYHACLSQAGAFAAQSSILFSIVNGFATLEERRLQENARVAAEAAEKARAEQQKAEQERAAAKPPEPPALPPTPVAAPDPPKVPETQMNGHHAQEAAGKAKTKPSGGKRKKP